MPGKKTLNLTKLKSSSDRNELNTKKQETISKFFSSSFKHTTGSEVKFGNTEETGSSKVSQSSHELMVLFYSRKCVTTQLSYMSDGQGH